MAKLTVVIIFLLVVELLFIFSGLAKESSFSCLINVAEGGSFKDDTVCHLSNLLFTTIGLVGGVALVLIGTFRSQSPEIFIVAGVVSLIGSTLLPDFYAIFNIIRGDMGLPVASLLIGVPIIIAIFSLFDYFRTALA